MATLPFSPVDEKLGHFFLLLLAGQMGVLDIEVTLGISIVPAIDIPEMVLVQDENPTLAYRIGRLEDPFGNLIVECTPL
ncbi:hypothetical protein E8E11_003000 [Didymella keratinophila]|nr:hypothetical protein E8E11_003000 [Didymella keratinophila]